MGLTQSGKKRPSANTQHMISLMKGVQTRLSLSYRPFWQLMTIVGRSTAYRCQFKQRASSCSTYPQPRFSAQSQTSFAPRSPSFNLKT
ncbi:hypothetical protein FGO68_gene3677 [Halteria grandinella]|uniref:Uncharacterized protein n=1 Tax=Halteria grandinella TaxID=5974 RepID=A0A8J8NUA4_HALGN|nr:hypothetical protein FGO68_gene3677 [Halteria grandinella]